MKRLILILLVLVSVSAFSQSTLINGNNVLQYTTFRGGLQADSAFRVPVRNLNDVYPLTLKKGRIVLRSVDSTLHYNDGGAYRKINATYYNASGEIKQNIKVWSELVVGSIASGQITSIASAGFSTIISVQVTPIENVSNQNGALISVKSVSTSSVVTNIYRSKTTGVLLGGTIDGLEFHTSPSNVSFYLTVIGY